MLEHSELIQCLDEKLSEFNYSRDAVISIPSIHYIASIKSKNIFQFKNLCAFIEMPAKIVDKATAKSFVEFLKKCLLKQYGAAVLWKELEMFFVVSCDTELYEILKQDEGAITNHPSFSLITLLGVWFIDRNTFDNFAKSTWGLHFSGNHFAAINDIVTQCCESQKSRLNVVNNIK